MTAQEKQSNWPCVMTIAGSDSGAGAGIQADLKTMSALKTYGVSVITAVTSQNTKGVTDVLPVPAEHVASQMAALIDDFPIKSIKLGMLCNEDVVLAISEQLAGCSDVPLVIDPVVVSSSGRPLLSDKGVQLMVDRLVPRALLLTPNIGEAALLLNEKAEIIQRDPEQAARRLLDLGCQGVLLKGGHREGDCCEDVLVSRKGCRLYSGKRVLTRNNHGTGCTLSSAIAAFVALGLTMEDAVAGAKNYIQRCLLAADELNLGSGSGPMQHFHF